MECCVVEGFENLWYVEIVVWSEVCVESVGEICFWIFVSG